MVQLSHPYMTTGKTIAFIIRTFVGKVISLLFNTLSRFIIVFLARSKHLLISWLQSLPTVILETTKIESATVSTVSPSICHEVMGPNAMMLSFWMLTFKPPFSESPYSNHFLGHSCPSFISVLSFHFRCQTDRPAWGSKIMWERLCLFRKVLSLPHLQIQGKKSTELLTICFTAC